ncbi:MAG: polysaccharide export protein [Candidatus Omnitrophica bacterium]|nr:polysaccharide export protein [Candidatus Omnitrophota bacterium]
MSHFYRSLFSVGLTSVCAVLLAAGIVHGQNFAGTVTPENLPPSEQPAQPQENMIDQPLPTGSSPRGTSGLREESNPAAQTDDSAASVDIPEEISNMSHYTVGATDVLEITVMRHPEVSGEFIINNEGNIQYEFVGDVHVDGLTKEDARKVLTEKLSTYIIDPDVTVKIAGYNSKIIYVVGEVGRPGKIYMQGDTMTVHEALVEAGLPLLSAKTNAGRVITPSNTGSPVIRKVNVEKLLYHGDLRENLVMQPGDTLYVPPTFLAKTMRVIQPVAAPIGTAAGTGRSVMMTGF